MGTEIRALRITQNLRSDWRKYTRIERLHHTKNIFAQTSGLFIVDFGLNVNMSTYINFQSRAKLPRDADLSFNRLRLFPGKKGNVINQNFSPITYKKSKNQLTHSLPEKWLKLRLNFPFERQKQIAINKVNNCLLEDSAAVQIR